MIDRSKIVHRLWRDTTATAMLEFALAMPLLLAVGLGGAEATNRAIVQMRVNQLAVLVADNASRVGENSLLGEVELFESDVNDIFMGVDLQAGGYIDLLQNGRVILSSLEVVPDTDDKQYIHWQRCKGVLSHPSSYGTEGDGSMTGIDGIGPADAKVYAFKGEAVMFVEVAYTYEPIIANLFASDEPIGAIASFNVRNNRDLTGIKQRDEADPDPVSDCDTFDDFPA